MDLLITGAGGMLGRDLISAIEAAGHRALPFTRAELDVTDVDALRARFAELRPQAVIHCAAATAVDACEQTPDDAYRVNAWGSWAVATAAEAVGAKLVLVSTDFVFDGVGLRPYTEFDPVRPINVYGASKLAGEEAAQRACSWVAVARTQWLFGLHGRPFPLAILNAAAQGRPLRVVTDQVGSPTFTPDLAAKLVWLAEQPCPGIYHLSNAGVASRYEWATETLRLAGWDDIPVARATSAEFPTPAVRPAYSALRNYALELRGVPLLRPWREALADYVAQLRATGALPERVPTP